jgi:hypothetical protein
MRFRTQGLWTGIVLYSTHCTGAYRAYGAYGGIWGRTGHFYYYSRTDGICLYRTVFDFSILHLGAEIMDDKFPLGISD